ncbi:MAG: methyl-accepting chemotaxis protein [Myxococcota bacterium]
MSESSTRIAEIQKRGHHRFKADLVTVQTELSEMVEFTRHSSEACNDIAARFGAISDVATNAKGRSGDARSLVESASGSMEEMRSALRKVETLGRDILSIAEETKMLALNAGIESARSGVAGRAFGVIASQVKELAENARRTADSAITGLKTVEQLGSRAAKEMSSATASTNELDDSIHSLASLIGETVQDNEKANEGVHLASHRLFVTLAKLDHIIWKLNTYLSVAEGEAQFQFVDHHNCRLGKWYDDGPGRKNFSKVPAYPALEAPHALVHTGTRAVLAELGARAETLSAAQIEAIARGLEQMERGSEGVFRVLSELTAR